MTHRSTGAALAAAAVLVLGACGGDDESSSAPSATTAEATESTTADATTAPPTTAAAATATTAAPVTAAIPTTAPGTDAEPTEPSDTAGTTAPATGDLWEDPSGTFRIAFPVDPSVQNVQAPLPDGTSLPVTAYLAEVAGAAAIASCVVYPDDNAPDASVLDSARDGALANVGAELVTSEPIELQGRQGVSYRGVIGEAGGVLARTYLDGAQLCQVLVVGEPTTIEETAPAILDSFEFVKEAA